MESATSYHDICIVYGETSDSAIRILERNLNLNHLEFIYTHCVLIKLKTMEVVQIGSMSSFFKPT